MKKLAFWLALALAAPLSAQTTTTYTGTIKDLTGETVTSGAISFTLNAPTGGVIPGTGTFVSTTIQCGIDSSGHPVAISDGVSPCVVTNNTAITPTGTSYKICIQPQYVTPGSCFVSYATGGTIDLSSVYPVPTTGPFNYGGVPGPPNQLAIGTVTTLLPGQSATATLTGTTPFQILNFSIPAGLPGGAVNYPGVNSDGNNGLNLIGGVATESVAAQLVNGVYGPSKFSLKCDGTTDDSTGLNAIGTFAAAQSAGHVVTVLFPSNAVCVSAFPVTTWATPNLYIVGNGSRIKFTGSGHGLYLHTASSEVDNIKIQGITLQGNASIDYLIYEDSVIARSTLQIDNMQDAANACAYLASMQLMDKVSLACSSAKAQVSGTPQTTTPTNGLILGDPGLSGIEGYFANNRNVNLTVEGWGTGKGVWCQRCTNGNVFVGTAEGGGTGAIGLQTDPTSWGDTFTAFDTEQMGTGGSDVVENGIGNVYLNFYSDGLFHITSAVRPQLIGGRYNTITVDSTAFYPVIHDLVYNVQHTGAFNQNSVNMANVQRVFDLQAGTMYNDGRSNLIGTGGVAVTTWSSDVNSRNWGWLPDVFGAGYLSLYESVDNYGNPVSGTERMRVAPDGSFYTYGHNQFQKLSGFGVGLTPATDGGATHELYGTDAANVVTNWYISDTGDALFNSSVGAGGNTVYRCATSGTLPAGALTVAPASCGSTTDTGLRAK